MLQVEQQAHDEAAETCAIRCDGLRVEYAARTQKKHRSIRRSKHRDNDTTQANIIAVRDVSLTIHSGERVCLLGPNGSGKSSLMRVLAGLQQSSAGMVEVFGFSPTDPRAASARGDAFQTVSLDSLLTVRENLMLFGASDGLAQHEAHERVALFANQMEFADRLDQRVGTLSGGFARRVDLARAMLSKPTVLLLDEPTSGLDPTSRRMFFDTIEPAGDGQSQPAVLLSTHLLDEVSWAERVVLMHEGRIAADGSMDELVRSFGDRALRIASQNQTLPESVSDYLAAHKLDAHATSTSDKRMLVPLQKDAIDTAAHHVAALSACGVEVSVGQATLGDVFESLTGDQLGGGST